MISIPQVFVEMKTLESLDLRNNSIKTLPTQVPKIAFFLYLQSQLGAMNLKKLMLEGNMLKVNTCVTYNHH
jgi:Leucine-rich repeat (LRR) protein